VPGQRFIEAADLVIRVCTQHSIVPPALALYHSARTHYHHSDDGVCCIYLSARALHSDRYPTQLYHEIAHHLQAVHEGDYHHNAAFTKYLLAIIDGDNFKLDYDWSHEYVAVGRLAAKACYLPRDYDAKKWSTLRDYNERTVSEAPG